MTSPCTNAKSPRSTSDFHADHGLQLGTVALLQRREAELAGVSDEDDAPHDADHLAGGGVGVEFGKEFADLTERMRARDRNRIGLTALLEQPVPLGTTNP
jgi:hypothetical protein